MRLRQFFAGRSLWLDEAMLARNLTARSFAGLLRPLDLNQAAPAGFLWLVKALTLVAGTDEWVLRLIPLLAGLASLPALWLLARRATGSRWAAAFATALLAASLEATFYAAEFKQYGLDLLAAVVVPLLALRLLDAGPARPAAARWAALLLAGTGFILVSHAAVFVAAGAGLTLLAAFAVRRQWREVAASAAVGAVWLGVFGLLWVFVYRAGAGNRFLSDYWAKGFLPVPGQPGGDARLWLVSFYSMLQMDFAGPSNLLNDRFAGALILGAAIGAAVLLGQRRGAALAALWLPIALAIAASMARLYPFSDRLLLFTAAATLVTAAAGFGRVVELLLAARQRPERTAGWATAAALLLFPAVCGAAMLLQTQIRQEFKPVFRRMAPLVREGDFVYRHRLAEPLWQYYAPRLGLSDCAGGVARPFDLADAQSAAEIDHLSRLLRVWVVTGFEPWNDGKDLTPLFAELGRRGRLVKWIEGEGYAAARLYEFPPMPTTRP